MVGLDAHGNAGPPFLNRRLTNDTHSALVLLCTFNQFGLIIETQTYN